MADDSSSSSEEFIPFSKRESFADITPIPQDDGPDPIVPLNYPEEFKEIMDYFRAIVAADELSERALEVTSSVIEWSCGNYTAWYYRRLILDARETDWNVELEFVSEQAREHPKNYQIWNHRRIVVEKLGNTDEEIDFVNSILAIDAKNYHAWAHRQWVVEKYNLWEGELEESDSELVKDVRNNSAWNYRFFIVSKTTEMDAVTIKKEIEYAIQKIGKAPNNESSWSYLNGLVKGKKYSDFPEIEAFCTEKRSAWPTCAYMFSTLIDIAEEKGTNEALEDASQCCQTLIKGVDDIHQKYWQFREAEINKRIASH